MNLWPWYYPLLQQLFYQVPVLPQHPLQAYLTLARLRSN
jgi:hypothetical protein